MFTLNQTFFTGQAERSELCYPLRGVRLARHTHDTSARGV